MVATVTPPGESEMTLLPWIGAVETPASVPFRSPPEEEVIVHDFVPCDDLAGRSNASREALIDSVRAGLQR